MPFLLPLRGIQFNLSCIMQSNLQVNPAAVGHYFTAWGTTVVFSRFSRPIVAVLLVTLFSGGVLARSVDQDTALRLRREGDILPFQDLLNKALERYPGATLLEAELEESHGLFIYEVEIITVEGIVREINLNASDGSILKDKVDD